MRLTVRLHLATPVDAKQVIHNYPTIFNTSLDPKATKGLASILCLYNRDVGGAGLSYREHFAYMLSTFLGETGNFHPVREAYWLSEAWRKRNLRYYPWYGRGLVQITWKNNYIKAKRKTSYDIVSDPDLAMHLPVAWEIARYGMSEGWFTGRSLSTYINHRGVDFRNARRIINGMDRADEFEDYAESFDLLLETAAVSYDQGKEAEASARHMEKEATNVLIPPVAKTRAFAGAPTIKMNTSRKGFVIEMQSALNVWSNDENLGVANLKIDGEFGPKTLNRIIMFQQYHLLTPTGAVDAATWYDLDRYV